MTTEKCATRAAHQAASASSRPLFAAAAAAAGRDGRPGGGYGGGGGYERRGGGYGGAHTPADWCLPQLDHHWLQQRAPAWGGVVAAGGAAAGADLAAGEIPLAAAERQGCRSCGQLGVLQVVHMVSLWFATSWQHNTILQQHPWKPTLWCHACVVAMHCLPCCVCAGRGGYDRGGSRGFNDYQEQEGGGGYHGGGGGGGGYRWVCTRKPRPSCTGQDRQHWWHGGGSEEHINTLNST